METPFLTSRVFGGCQSETCVAGKGKDCHVPGIRPGKGVLELDSEGKRLRYID